MDELIPVERIESKIYLIRGQKVMLDRDLAELYGVPTGRLNEQVQRNLSRFPTDFMFQITKEEAKNLIFQSGMSSSANLKSQFATSSLPAGKVGWGGTRKLPRVFTEQGIAMLSSVLNSERAVQVNIMIMRAFVKLRQTLALNKELAEKFHELEARVSSHDSVIVQIIDEINKILNPPLVQAIGFNLSKDSEGD